MPQYHMEGGMSKIAVGTCIIDLAQCFCIKITATKITFQPSCLTGSECSYINGTDLSNANFDTLSAWLTNQTNNPYTTVV